MFKTILGLAQVNSRENVEINKQYMSSFGWIELSFDLNLIYSRKLIGNDLSVPLCHFCIKKRSIRRCSDKRLSVIGTGQRLRNYLLFTTNKTFVSRPRPALELKIGPWECLKNQGCFASKKLISNGSETIRFSP